MCVVVYSSRVSLCTSGGVCEYGASVALSSCLSSDTTTVTKIEGSKKKKRIVSLFF
jgi:hypothetical protein